MKHDKRVDFSSFGGLNRTDMFLASVSAQVSIGFSPRGVPRPHRPGRGRRVPPDARHPRAAVSRLHPQAHPVVRLRREVHQLRPGGRPYGNAILVGYGLLFEVVRLGNVAYDISRLTDSKIQYDSLSYSVKQDLVCQTQSLHLHRPRVSEGLCCPVSLILQPSLFVL